MVHGGGLIGLDGSSLDGVDGGGGGGVLPAGQAVTNGNGLSESTWLSLGGGPVGNGVVTVTGAEVDHPGADLVIDAGARDSAVGGVGAVAGGIDGGVLAAGQHPVPGGGAPHDVGGGEGGAVVGLGGHGVEEDDHLGLMKAAAEQSAAEQKQADEELAEAEQSLRLRQLVEERQLVVGTSGAKDWTNIARKIPPKTDLQCMLHWNHVINPELTKGKGSWKQEEDERIMQLVEHHGKKWSVIATQLKAENGKMTRVGKQIRERYLHHLDPNLKKGDWSVQEEEVLVREHGIHKNKWAQIAKSLPGRCSNDIKNHWYAHERRQREISRASTSSTAAATETPPIVVQRTTRPFPISMSPHLARILPAPAPPRQVLSESEDGGDHHHGGGGVGEVLLERPQESPTSAAPGAPVDSHFLGGVVVDGGGGAPEQQEESVEVEDRRRLSSSIDDGLLLQQPAGDYDPTHVAGSGGDGGNGGGSGGGGDDGSIDDHDHRDMMMMIMASHAMPLPPPPAPAEAPAPAPGTDAGGDMVGPVPTAEEEVDPGQDFGLPLAKRARIDGGDHSGGGGGDAGGEGHDMLIGGSGVGSVGVSDVEDENTVADSFVGSGFGSDEHAAVGAGGGGGGGGDGGRIDDDVVGAGSGVMDHFGATEIGGDGGDGGGLERFEESGTIGDGDLERFEPAEATGDVDNGGGSASAVARLEEHHAGIGSDGEDGHNGVDGGDADCVFSGWDRLRNEHSPR
ncbi:unnamed protein product [Ectocarpus fasciculatus]